MIIDPACSVVFEVEPEEPGTMNRPPRDRNEPLLSRRRLLLSLAQGLGVLAAVLAVFVISLQRGADENTARALTFATLIVANIGLIMVNRSWHRSLLKTLRTYNSAVWWVVGGALLFLGLVIYTPGLQDVFHFAPLPAIDLVIALVAGVASILWFEFMKLLGRAF
jgi:Ca2+-transporting ATPase